MDKDKYYINWQKLEGYPCYDGARMKVNESYELSVIDLTHYVAMTPDSMFKDTTSDPDTLKLCVFIRRYVTDESDNAVRIEEPISKEKFKEIMAECVMQEPKRYLWQHPEIDQLMQSCIVKLCHKLNVHGIGGLYVRAGKEYVLSNGKGFIYNGDTVSGAFSGLTMSVRKESPASTQISIKIPKYIHNQLIGTLRDAKFVYSDPEANIAIEFTGKSLTSSTDNLVFEMDNNVFEMDNNTNDLKFIRIDKGQKQWYMPIDDNPELLQNKQLIIPIKKVDFRIESMLSKIAAVRSCSKQYMEHAFKRIDKAIEVDEVGENYEQSAQTGQRHRG